MSDCSSTTGSDPASMGVKVLRFSSNSWRFRSNVAFRSVRVVVAWVFSWPSTTNSSNSFFAMARAGLLLSWGVGGGLRVVVARVVARLLVGDRSRDRDRGPGAVAHSDRPLRRGGRARPTAVGLGPAGGADDLPQALLVAVLALYDQGAEAVRHQLVSNLGQAVVEQQVQLSQGVRPLLRLGQPRKGRAQGRQVHGLGQTEFDGLSLVRPQ